MNVARINQAIARLEAQRNKVLAGERSKLQGRIDEIDALTGGNRVRKAATVRKAAKKVSTPRVHRGSFRAAALEILTKANGPVSYHDVAKALEGNQTLGRKLSESAVQNGMYALANRENSNVSRVGKGVFQLRADVPIATPVTA